MSYDAAYLVASMIEHYNPLLRAGTPLKGINGKCYVFVYDANSGELIDVCFTPQYAILLAKNVRI